MAYFDSEKNKAMWQRRLAGLEQERERRVREGYKPGTQRSEAKVTDIRQVRAGVRIITFDELVRKEQAKHQATRTMQRTRERELIRQPAVKSL